jgi:aminoglycoside phosphotransferase (APT) family kinase protein
MTSKMHSDELELDAGLVRRLVAGQFPDWAGLPVSRVEPQGTDNAIFRLGDRLSVRLARRDGPTQPGGKEFDWLAVLAPALPVEIPIPVAQGKPSDDYPYYWDVLTWVDGQTVPAEAIDAVQAAHDLAAIVRALQDVDATGAPPGRGVPLADRDEGFRYWLPRFRGDPAVAQEWERALAAPPWSGPPVWLHGDLDARNWTVKDGRINGLIDWGGTMGAGDPACDVAVAWKLHSASACDAFRASFPVDDATWERARGWVVSQTVAILAYYTQDNNPTLYQEAQAWLGLVLADRG